MLLRLPCRLDFSESLVRVGETLSDALRLGSVLVFIAFFFEALFAGPVPAQASCFCAVSLFEFALVVVSSAS